MPLDCLVTKIHAVNSEHVVGQVDSNAHKFHLWTPSHG